MTPAAAWRTRYDEALLLMIGGAEVMKQARGKNDSGGGKSGGGRRMNADGSITQRITSMDELKDFMSRRGTL